MMNKTNKRVTKKPSIFEKTREFLNWHCQGVEKCQPSVIRGSLQKKTGGFF